MNYIAELHKVTKNKLIPKLIELMEEVKFKNVFLKTDLPKQIIFSHTKEIFVETIGENNVRQYNNEGDIEKVLKSTKDDYEIYIKISEGILDKIYELTKTKARIENIIKKSNNLPVFDKKFLLIEKSKQN